MLDHIQQIPTIQKLRLLDQVRTSIRTKHNSLHSKESYINWIKIFVLFHLSREIKLYFFLFIDFLLHVITKTKIQKFAISHGAGKKHPGVIGEKQINEFHNGFCSYTKLRGTESA